MVFDLGIPLMKVYCENCRHYIGETSRCPAFGYNPIPWAIFFGADKHLKPVKGQRNNIVFEPKNR
jgi:hypothetical protein